MNIKNDGEHGGIARPGLREWDGCTGIRCFILLLLVEMQFADRHERTGGDLGRFCQQSKSLTRDSNLIRRDVSLTNNSSWDVACWKSVAYLTVQLTVSLLAFVAGDTTAAASG